MTRKRSLPKVAQEQTGLGLSTIMDRALAAAHGVRYVHLAAFAIDIDRVYWLDPEDGELPFGWEVFLTECYLLGELDCSTAEGRELIENVCSDLMEESPGEPPLGGQLVFAAYDALQRNALPSELSTVFAGWRHPPKELVHSLSQLWNKAQDNLVLLARHCLQAELSPPLSPPTREALNAMLAGTFPLKLPNAAGA